MKGIKIRAIISLLITITTFFFGYFIISNMIAIGVICIALVYVSAVIAGGCFWIGSKQ